MLTETEMDQFLMYTVSDSEHSIDERVILLGFEIQLDFFHAVNTNNVTSSSKWNVRHFS